MNSYEKLKKLLPETFIYNVYPEDNGLLTWGYTDNGDELYWKVNLGSKEWEIIVFDGGEFYSYKMSMTEFLFKILSRQIKCAAFPDSFPSVNAKYNAIKVEEDVAKLNEQIYFLR